MSELKQYFAMLDRVSKTIDTLPRRAGTEAVNFSKERFKQQNWVDTTTKPWKKRKPVKGESRRRAGRKILVDSGRLRRSIRRTHADRNTAIVGTDVPYAGVHNYGFRGRVTQRVTSKKGKRFTRVLNQNIPQRQFLGESQVLNKRIVRMMTAEIRKAIKF